MTWSEATQNVIQRYCSRHNSSIFTLKGLINEELKNIIRDSQTKGKTPRQTLQYCLQRLRDQGFVEFIDKLSDENSRFNKALRLVSKGADKVQKLGRFYNKVAPYFALPSIPPILLGKEESEKK